MFNSIDTRPMYKLLDHGYLRFVEDWGHGDHGSPEAGIIEAARMSTDKAFQGWDAVKCEQCGTILPMTQSHTSAPGVFCPNREIFKDVGDKHLLRYLYEHKHSTPFEFAGMILEIHAPIMVFREWQRHRTQAFGEMSARYIPMPNEHYLPNAHDLVQRSEIAANSKNRQAGGSKVITWDEASYWLHRLNSLYKASQDVYEEGLALGVPKELARLAVAVARYSRMRACTSLRNWLAFLTLRMDPAAQWEIRQYANACGEVIKKQFPRTWALFSLGK